VLSDLADCHNRSLLHYFRLITVNMWHRKLGVFGCPNARTSSSNPTACSSVVVLFCVDTGLLSGPSSVQIEHSQNVSVNSGEKMRTVPECSSATLEATYQTALRQINQDLYLPTLTPIFPSSFLFLP
jgi:hypothetical protein